ncbi:MAG TPA: hypothetical protein VGK58_17955, partial [Lacipirellulaceae bacterium]
MITQATRTQFVFVSLASICLFSAPAQAVTTNWIDNSGGQFTTAANWDNGVPDAADVAFFDRGSGVTYTVTIRDLLGADITNDRLVVGSNTVTFNPIGTDYILDNTATTEADPILGLPVRGVTIGAQANDTAAVLTSQLSLLQTVAATLGHAAGSSGTLTLDQNNDLFNVTGGSTTNAELIIGRLGTGVLNVSAGADVTVNGVSAGFPAGNISLGRGSSGQGTANISGAGSTLDTNTLLVVGDAGTGTLNVTAGGLVESLSGILGDLAGSTGTATISGVGSRWNVAFLSVGDAGTGTLNVLDGGTVDIPNVGIVSINGSSTLNLDNGTIDGDVNNSGQTNVTGPATITGSLDNAVGAETLIDWAEPVGVVGLDVGGGITNAGAVNIMIDYAEPVGIAALHAGGNVTNSGTLHLTIHYVEPISEIATLDVDGNLTNSGDVAVNINYAEPIADARPVAVGGNMTNDGTFDLMIDWAQPVGLVGLDVAGSLTNHGTINIARAAEQDLTIQLGAGQALTNGATGVVNLTGPGDVNGDLMISGKHIVAGNVVNNGQMNVRTNAQVAGSLTTAVDSETIVHPAEPISGIVFEVASSVSNSGSFTMQIDSAEPINDVKLQLGPGQTFTNNATGVVNLDGPVDVGGAQVIESKHTVGGNVVNQGEMNIRTNAQIAGSLAVSVDADLIIDAQEPCCSMTVEVAGPVANSGTLTMRNAVALAAGAELGSGAANHREIILDARAGFTNSGTFNMASATEEEMFVLLPAGGSFVNNAAGIVNLDGPDDLNGDDMIETKHTIAGDVVNQGRMNVRTNAQIAGSLEIAVDADLIIDSQEPCCGMVLEVGGGVSNSGEVTLRVDAAEPVNNILQLGGGENFTNNATGILQGTGTIAGNVLNRGQVRPGNSTGVLAVSGDFTQENDGTLVVEIGGTTPGSQHDQLAI